MNRPALYLFPVGFFFFFLFSILSEAALFGASLNQDFFSKVPLSNEILSSLHDLEQQEAMLQWKVLFPDIGPEIKPAALPSPGFPSEYFRIKAGILMYSYLSSKTDKTAYEKGMDELEKEFHETIASISAWLQKVLEAKGIDKKQAEYLVIERYLSEGTGWLPEINLFSSLRRRQDEQIQRIRENLIESLDSLPAFSPPARVDTAWARNRLVEKIRQGVAAALGGGWQDGDPVLKKIEDNIDLFYRKVGQIVSAGTVPPWVGKASHVAWFYRKILGLSGDVTPQNAYFIYAGLPGISIDTIIAADDSATVEEKYDFSFSDSFYEKRNFGNAVHVSQILLLLCNSLILAEKEDPYLFFGIFEPETFDKKKFLLLKKEANSLYRKALDGAKAASDLAVAHRQELPQGASAILDNFILIGIDNLSSIQNGD